jgi:D-3-phosphoglycerate dehydrogenase / 2-oxoglutarate reductase
MARFKVVVSDHAFSNVDPERRILEPLGAEVIERQCQSLEELLLIARDADALLVTYVKPIGEELFKANPRLRVVVRYAIGIDTLDIPAATRYGILMVNVPEYCLDEVSDHTIALFFALARKVVISDKKARSGDWNLLFLKPLPKLQGKTVGFLGFGRIGQRVAKKLGSMDLQFVYYDPYVQQEQIENARKASLEEVLRRSDFLSIHAPETKETKHLLNRQTLALMKPTAFLINTARGGLVDTNALVARLQAGQLAGVALDVIENTESLPADHPLCSMDNVILTPHSAWYSDESEVELQIIAAEEVARALRGETPKALLNPEVLRMDRWRSVQKLR